jgi:hypothetical protein
VFKLHPANGFSNASRFVEVQRERFGRGDSTKSTRPSASFPRDHKGGGSLAPALPSIRALRRLADRVKPKIGDKRFCGKEDGIGRQTDLDPLRLFCLMQRWVDFGPGHQTVKLMAWGSKSNRPEAERQDRARSRMQNGRLRPLLSFKRGEKGRAGRPSHNVGTASEPQSCANSH